MCLCSPNINNTRLHLPVHDIGSALKSTKTLQWEVFVQYERAQKGGHESGKCNKLQR